MNNLFKQVKKKFRLFRQHLTNKIKFFRACRHRTRIDHVTFIGITGSAGKTTTTDLTSAMLAHFGPCQQTQASNMLDSVVKIILETKRQHRYCVAEVAAYGPGTLDLPIQALKPDIAVITVIGRDHYSAYKSMDAIAAEKEKMVLSLPPGGTAVLNMDDPWVRSMGERCTRRIIWFGESKGATLRLREALSRWPEPLSLFFDYQDKTYEIRTQLHGTHMAKSVLAALGVALAAGLPLEEAILAVAQVQSYEGRMQMVTGDDGVVFIRDDVKAPYWSLNAPLAFLKEANADRKVAIVGTISDFSGDRTKNYKKFCRQIREVADLVVFVGPHAHRALRARQSKNDASIQGFASIRYAATYLQTELRKGDLVLLKGSQKADHLVRLIINRTRPILCWKDHCKKVVFCDKCRRLYKPSPQTTFATPINLVTGQAVHVVVGLGNQEARFNQTLHNVGYRVLDNLARTVGAIWLVEPEGLVCTLELKGITVQLLKAGTAMNNSGARVRCFLERIGSDPRYCTIVHDDADLSLGDVRYKSSGGDAGHKGVRSIISALGTGNIQRVRIGVGLPDDERKAKQIVLTEFSASEEALLLPAIEQAAAMVREYLQRQGKDQAEDSLF